MKFSLPFLVLVSLFSCAPHEKHKNVDAPSKDTIDKKKSLKTDISSLKNIGYYKLDGDSLIIPSFDIDVSLTKKAKRKFKESKETIIVAAFFTGQPKDTTSKEYLENGEIFIVSSKKEINDGQVAKFFNVKFSKKLYNSLADKDIKLQIEVYSGRRSINENLLNSDLFQDKMSNINDKLFTIKCKLIYGDD